MVTVNSMAKIATLGITFITLFHKCMRCCCCPGAGSPWIDERDDEDGPGEGGPTVVGSGTELAVRDSEPS